MREDDVCALERLNMLKMLIIIIVDALLPKVICMLSVG